MDLYDRDRIVSRTVSYATVIGLLAAYIVVVAMLSRLTPGDCSLNVAASTRLPLPCSSSLCAGA